MRGSGASASGSPRVAAEGGGRAQQPPAWSALSSVSSHPITITAPSATTPGAPCSLYGVHDDTKDKPMEVELSWLSEETGWRHVKVPDDKLAAAVAWAKAKIEEEERGSDSDDDDDDDDDE